MLLGARQLGLSLVVRNTGTEELQFTTGLHTHVAVTDIRDDDVVVAVRCAACRMQAYKS